MSKQERVVSQGVNFIIRDFNECYEEQDNGFTYHVPFILSADEMSVSCVRSAIIDDIESGENWEIIREDIGFITSENRFVDPVEAMKIAIGAGQFEYLAYKDMEIKILERMKLTTQAGISKKLRDGWIEIVSDRGLLPEDLY